MPYSKNLLNMKGGFDSKKTFVIIFIVLAIILVLYLVLKIIYSLYNNDQDKGDCTSNNGCLMLAEIKNAKKAYTIESHNFPPSNPGAGYSITTWLFINSNNFQNRVQHYKTIFCRGDSKTYNNFNDLQYSAQPGVWLYGNTNKILLRWDTGGRISSLINCTEVKKPCSPGTRCRMPNDQIKYCNKKSQLEEENLSNYSMNPYINPPNKLCSGALTKQDILWNTSDANMDNETCIDNVPLDRWFQLAIVVHNQSVDIYVDGQLYSTLTLNSVPINNSNADLEINRDSSPFYQKLNGFDGGMSQLRYFNKSLTPYDILRLYSWGPMPFKKETSVAKRHNTKKEVYKPNQQELLGSDNY